ncbi:MAG: L-idonate 5-dehydrogenase [Armatimonadetes bacterium]|nr:L-idonate 5-dehydrogenase [Armatimonadota bacterium]
MTDTMTAAVLYGARDLRLVDHPRPDLLPGMVRLRPRRVGICGSDLHYYQHGFCGGFVPDRPFVLGHELSAEVVELGVGVATVAVGDRVTVNPARACGFCDDCKGGRPNLCRLTIMLGSASTTPPTDGAFAEFLTVRADQCHRLPEALDDGLGAMMEPFAVALHAVHRAGSVAGRRVLVTGAGTIGLLVAMTARAFGAVPVAVTDVSAERRRLAAELAADVAFDPAQADRPGDGFDVVFEASGARAALRQAFDLVRPGGTIVQIGTLGTEDVPLPANAIMAREISLLGSFRYGNVFGEAIALAAAGRVALGPLITAVLPLADVTPAMDLADDKTHSLKVQMAL